MFFCWQAYPIMIVRAKSNWHCLLDLLVKIERIFNLCSFPIVLPSLAGSSVLSAIKMALPLTAATMMQTLCIRWSEFISAN